MKRFSISNKPAVKANNKQSGIVFLEYVIMAFIVTVAVICALWWFYWHLQQMTWEVKQKLDTLKTLNCELGKPGGSESVQPTPVQPGEPEFPGTFYRNTHPDPETYKYEYIENIPWANQQVIFHNTSGADMYVRADFYSEGNSFPDVDLQSPYYTLPPGDSTEPIIYSHTPDEPPPWRIALITYSTISSATYTVTITQAP